MSVEGIHTWVEGVARAAPAPERISVIATAIVFMIFFIVYSFVI
jgi:hypothetical protein